MSKFKENTIPVFFKTGSKNMATGLGHTKKEGFIPTFMERAQRTGEEPRIHLFDRVGDRLRFFPRTGMIGGRHLAILPAGAINADLPSTKLFKECQYILNNSGTRLCFVSSEDHLDRVLKAKKATLKKIVISINSTRKRRTYSA